MTSSAGKMPARLGVLLSGRGSNFLALHEAIQQGQVPATIALVVSNVEGAAGIERARSLGLETVTLPHGNAGGREVHDRAVVAALREANVEWVCLAGYMRVLTPAFIDAFPERILNVHPSLLPSFPGLNAQEQAFAHGVRVAGCTVHLVDAGLDSGPIVVQRAVGVHDGETEGSLSARILAEEHQAYPEALCRLIREPWRIEGRRLCFGAQNEDAEKDR